jgi:hypothetical protein
MAVTSHVYPLAMLAVMEKTIDLHADTMKAVLFTGDASAWTSTQEAYQFLSDLKTAYTECTDSDYARASIAGLSVTRSGNKLVWTCTSPISFGSSVTITARSMAIVDESVGSGDSSYPALAIIDFGQNYASTSSTWEYTVDGTNGLAAITAT